MTIAQTPGHIAHHIGTDDGGAVEVHDAPNEHVEWHRDNLIGHPVYIHVGGKAEVQGRCHSSSGQSPTRLPSNSHIELRCPFGP